MRGDPERTPSSQPRGTPLPQAFASWHVSSFEAGMLLPQPLGKKEVSQRRPVGEDIRLSVRGHRQFAPAGGDADDAGGIAGRELAPEFALSSGEIEPVNTDLLVVRSTQIEIPAIGAPLDRPFVAMQSSDGRRLAALGEIGRAHV